MNNIYIGCTAKLLTSLKIKKPEPLTEYDIPKIQRWHANLNYFERRKTILFTHDLSYYSFLLVGVKKSEIENLDNVFLDSAANILFKQGFNENGIISILPLKSRIIFGKSHNRSVIGIMNNFGRYIPFLYERYAMLSSGIPTLNQFEISRELNDTPVQCDKKGFFPLQKLKEIVDQQSNEV